MKDTVFVYKKDDNFKVINLDTPVGDRELKRDGWKHIETLSASVWLENLLNVTPEDRELAIDNLLYREI